MRIEQIAVSGLFGMYDHTVPLNMDERATIIHGPNGYGKTTLLSLIDGLFNQRFSVLRSTPFEELHIVFDDASSLVVSQKVAPSPRQMRLPLRRVPEAAEAVRPEYQKASLRFEWFRPGQKTQNHDLEPLDPRLLRRTSAAIRRMVDYGIPEFDRIGPSTWLYTRTNEVFGLEDLIDRFGDRIPPGFGHPEREVPEWIEECTSLVEVRFIEAQRLLRLSKIYGGRREGSEANGLLAVQTYSADLAGAIKTALAESAALSQSLDRTFPLRLVGQSESSALKEQELRERLAQIEKQRSRLMAAGLLDQDQEDVPAPPELDAHTQRVLTVYVGDVEQKLKVFNDLAEKIDLLKAIINERFQFKQMSIDKDQGFIFHTSEGNVLSPTDLSSGEQHELVLGVS